MRGRRTRRKYTWFPVRGTGAVSQDPDEFSQLFFSLDVNGNGNSNVIISPLIPDVPLEGDDINPALPGQLVQAIGQEYVVERIVGKFFVGVSGTVDDPGPPAVIFPKNILVGAGIFVARANDSDSGGGSDTPIGSASPQERADNYNPLSADGIREPWMWRRVWLLHTGRTSNQNPAGNVNGAFGPNVLSIGVASVTTAGALSAPKTNIGYGSVMDGPHVDVKSVRRVRNDERLWLAINARTIDFFLPNTEDPTTGLVGGVAGAFDYRVLGQLRRAKARSNF